jgi:hypothetical protein
MINRTFKFYGKAFSDLDPVFVTATFNNVQIHSGPVPTSNSWENFSNFKLTDVLFEFVGPIDLTGQIPLTLVVNNGQVKFGSVWANYSGMKVEIDNTDPDNPKQVVIVPPEDFYAPVYQGDTVSDVKINVKIDGQDRLRHEEDYPHTKGDWQYLISDSQTFSCDIVIDPQLIRTQITSD